MPDCALDRREEEGKGVAAAHLPHCRRRACAADGTRAYLVLLVLFFFCRRGELGAPCPNLCVRLFYLLCFSSFAPEGGGGHPPPSPY